MTIDEAIFCMNHYLPGSDVLECKEKCPYYGSVELDDGLYTCKAATAHKMAVEALEFMKKNTMQ